MVTVNQQRVSRKRTYLMCSPDYFAVEYAINPWMDVTTPVDADLAVKQWDRLRETLLGLGHEVHLLTPGAGLPDMVFAANGAFVVDGTVYGARFKHEQRSAEAAAHREFYEGQGWRFLAPSETNEGEGDFAYLPDAHGGLILAGHGFRTELAAHAEAQEALGRPVVSLRLVDPRFYHLDVALASIDDGNIVYYPGAFSAASQRVLHQLFPDAVVADDEDALAFGLNLVSDGLNVVLNNEATRLAGTLKAAGYQPVPVELAELKKGGGSVKCCIAELRH
ncbi:dimethylargininase [Micromonospora sp. WMMD998]|uniref:dimethylargininase n=1 Tax=Micromonospora sp. WMMD998 TaxID=3016092 RepID=UPI00249AAC18|nr:dimethylargininase [Micromonospora sp. WMMD998]WFE37534.1 amidinotransferase [Micromonospora sp. WMMD998]